jgi:hypothetical protein
MTITAPAPALARSTTHAATSTADPASKNVRAAGILYLLTFVSSIPALILIGPVLHDAGYVTGAGQDTRVLFGCLLDLVNALTAVGTAVALFPVLKRRNESMALGFVMSRMLEAAVVMIGVVSLVAVVAMRQNFAGSPGHAVALTATAHGLVEVRNWTFLFGPGLMPAFNAILFGTLLYRSRLVPRIIPTVGLVGVPLLLIAFFATLFGAIEQVSAAAFFLTLPIAAWEFSIGVWMAVKGFNSSHLAAGTDATESSPSAI